MVNADNTTKEKTERSESMRHFVVKSVLIALPFCLSTFPLTRGNRFDEKSVNNRLPWRGELPSAER
jgi:hypothetical protein